MKIRKKNILIIFGVIVFLAIFSAVLVIISEAITDSAPDIQFRLYKP